MCLVPPNNKSSILLRLRSVYATSITKKPRKAITRQFKAITGGITNTRKATR
jgi:hypothetical protein